jgi:hypothetical protein
VGAHISAQKPKTGDTRETKSCTCTSRLATSISLHQFSIPHIARKPAKRRASTQADTPFVSLGLTDICKTLGNSHPLPAKWVFIQGRPKPGTVRIPVVPSCSHLLFGWILRHPALLLRLRWINLTLQASGLAAPRGARPPLYPGLGLSHGLAAEGHTLCAVLSLHSQPCAAWPSTRLVTTWLAVCCWLRQLAKLAQQQLCLSVC